MRYLTLTLALALAIVVAPAHAADSDSPLTGTWTGDHDENTQRELVVRDVANPKAVEGWYCLRTPGVHQVHDFHGDGSHAGAVSASVKGRSLFTQIRDYKITVKVTRDGDHADVEARSKKGRTKFELDLIEAAAAPCRPRIVPLPVDDVPADDHPPGETYADTIAASGPDRHPLVGSWTGQRANGLTIELNVVSVTDDGSVRGVYCNTWASGWRATDMDPEIEGGIDATATETTLLFGHKGREFAFTADGNAMTYVQHRPGKKSRTLAMTRTDDPTCAARVIVPPATT